METETAMDTEGQGDRGTVKVDGTIADRRHGPPWTWIAFGMFAVLLLLMAVSVTVGAIITSNVSDAAEKATKASVEANRAVAKANLTIVRLDGAVRGSCERLQNERERSNVAEATIYLVLKAAARASNDRRAASVYRVQSEATAWSPPANCVKAVDDPEHYRPPATVPYTDLPRGYALQVVKAAQQHRPQPLP